VLVLIASLAAILLWLIGTAAERKGLARALRRVAVTPRLLAPVLARLLLTVEHCKAAAADLADAIGPLDIGLRVIMPPCSPSDFGGNFVGISQGQILFRPPTGVPHDKPSLKKGSEP